MDEDSSTAVAVPLVPGRPSSTATRFRKKPVVIEARQLSRANGPQLADWSGGQWTSLYGRGDRGEDISHVRIDTLEGAMCAGLGDWIIKGIKGEFYPCKPDIFAATYEAATVSEGEEQGSRNRETLSPSLERVAVLEEVRRLAIEECAKAVEGMRACPFAKGQTAPDISPDEPCPVCGDLGTLNTIGKPSKCEDAASTIRSLLTKAQSDAT